MQAESGLCFVMGDQPEAVTLQKKACLSYLPLFNAVGAEIFTIQAKCCAGWCCLAWCWSLQLSFNHPRLHPTQQAFKSHSGPFQWLIPQQTAGHWSHLFSTPCLGTEQQWLEVRGRLEEAWAAHRESYTAQRHWFARVHKAFHMQTLIYWVSGHTRQDACTPQEYTQKHMHTHPKHTETVITFVYTEKTPVSWPRTHTSYSCICRQNWAAHIHTCILLICRLCHHVP